MNSTRRGHPGKPKEVIRFCRLTELPGMEVMRVDHLTRPLCFYSATFGISYIRESSSVMQLGTDKRSMIDQSVCVVEPELQIRHLDISRPESVRILLLSVAALEDLSEELGIRLRRCCTKPDPHRDPELIQALDEFHRCMERSSTTTMELESKYLGAVRSVLTAMAKNGSTAAPAGHESEAVRRTRKLIHDRCEDKLTLTDLARVSGLGRYQLFRAFPREVGVPPPTFQLGVRLERAKALLLRGIPPAHVAADLGFYDQSHFTRCFRSRVGITPLQYIQ